MSNLVINNGSGYIKWGFDNEDFPSEKIPNIISSDLYETYPRSSIVNGTISDWEELVNIWDCSLNKKGIKCEEQKLLISLPLANFQKDRLYEILFEYFNFKSVYLADPNCLSLYGSGRRTGLIVDCGHHLTQINPVFEGYYLESLSKIINLGGQNIDEYLLGFIKNSGCPIQSLSFSKLHQFKHDCHQNRIMKDYQLPDGQVLKLDNIQINDMSNIMMNPSLIGKDTKGCGHQIVETIHSCDLNIRNHLFDNIILSGGNSLLTNFGKKLNTSISSYSEKKKFKVIEHLNPDNLQWQGGAIISQLCTFEKISITKKDFNEDKYTKKNISLD